MPQSLHALLFAPPVIALQGHMLLLGLSKELIVEALSHLEGHDLAACVSSCRFLNTLIYNTASLKYLLCLSAYGMKDNTSATSSLPGSEKLDLLSKYAASWRELDWNSVLEQSFPSEGHLKFQVQNNVLVVWFARTVHIRQLPSRLRGVPDKVWEFTFDFVVAHAVVDVSQDLLVVMECRGLEFHPTHAHVCTILDRQNVSVDPSSHGFSVKFEPDYANAFLNDSMLGLCGKRNGRRTVEVRNLRTRSPAYYYVPLQALETEIDETFCFIDNKSILVCRNLLGRITTLHVVALSPHSRRSGPDEICTLSLPSEVTDAVLEHNSSNTARAANSHFCPDNDYDLVVLCSPRMEMTFPMRNVKRAISIASAQNKGTPYEVPWFMWGKYSTFSFISSPFPPYFDNRLTGRVPLVYGSRRLLLSMFLSSENRTGWNLHIMDFHASRALQSRLLECKDGASEQAFEYCGPSGSESVGSEERSDMSCISSIRRLENCNEMPWLSLSDDGVVVMKRQDDKFILNYYGV